MINFLNWLDGVLWGVPLIVLMVVTGLYFTVRSGFFQFRFFGWIMKRTAGQLLNKEGRESGSDEKGMLSAFEAISTAIGGPVPTGLVHGPHRGQPRLLVPPGGDVEIHCRRTHRLLPRRPPVIPFLPGELCCS